MTFDQEIFLTAMVILNLITLIFYILDWYKRW